MDQVPTSNPNGGAGGATTPQAMPGQSGGTSPSAPGSAGAPPGVSGQADHAGSAPTPPVSPKPPIPPEAWDHFRTVAAIEAEKLSLKKERDAILEELKAHKDRDAKLRDRSTRYDVLEKEYGADIKEWSARKLNGEPGLEEYVKSLEEKVEALYGAVDTKAKEDENFKRSVHVKSYASELASTIASDTHSPIRQYQELQATLTGVPADLERDINSAFDELIDPQTKQRLPASRTAEIMLERAKERLSAFAKLPWVRELVLGQAVGSSPPAQAPGSPPPSAPPERPSSRPPAPPISGHQTQGEPANPAAMTMQQRLKAVEDKLRAAAAARAQAPRA